jgi:protein SCO1/2
MLGGALVAALAGLAFVGLTGSGGKSSLDLRAEPVAPPRLAPRTAGRDIDGAPVVVPRKGRPALVTFLFATCPDVCPLVASEISRALDRLGPTASGLDVVAVSVDPQGDTPRTVRDFLRRHRLTGRMRYIVGSERELQPIWRAWYAAAQPPGELGSVHTARIVLIDRTGRQVGAYSAGIPVSVDDLAADMRALLER